MDGADNRVYIIQILCPFRHCILAVAYEPWKTPHDEAMRTFKATWDKISTSGPEKLLNPWCELCSSKNLTFEASPTIFKTLKEANPYLQAMQAEQLRTQDAWKTAPHWLLKK